MQKCAESTNINKPIDRQICSIIPERLATPSLPIKKCPAMWGPPFTITKLVNITSISLWFMIPIKL